MMAEKKTLKVGIESKDAVKGAKKVNKALESMAREAKETAKDFTKSGNNSGRALDRLATDAQTSSGSIRESLLAVRAPALAIAAALAAVGTAAFSAAKNIDTITKSAGELGISTELYQKLEFVASQTDTKMRKVASSIRDLTLNLGRANEGNKVAIEGFKQLNIETRNLDGTTRDINVVYIEALKALQNIDNAADRAAIGQKTLGTSMLKMGNIMSLTNAQFDETADKINFMITDKQQKDAADFNDQWDLLSRTIGHEFNSAMAKILPVMTDAFNIMIKLTNEGLTPFIKALFEVEKKVLELGKTNAEVNKAAAARMAQERDDMKKVITLQTLRLDLAQAQKALSFSPDGSKAQIQGSIDAIKEEIRQLEIRNTVKAGGSASIAPTGGEVTVPQQGNEAKIAARRLQSLNDSYRTEEEVIRDTYTRRIAMIESAETEGLETSKGITALKLRELETRNSALAGLVQTAAKIKKDAANEEAALLQTSADEQYDIYKTGLDRLTAETQAAAQANTQMWKNFASSAAQAFGNLASAFSIHSDLVSEKIRDTALTQEEEILSQQARELENLEMLHAAKKISDEKYATDKLAIERRNAGLLVNLDKATTKKLDSEGKKAFEVAKKLKIAQAIISGGLAAIQAYAAGTSIGGPFALATGAAFAAASLIATGAMVKQISSTSYNSTSGINTGGGGSSVSVSAAPTPQAAQGSSKVTQVNKYYLTIQGNVMSKDFVENDIVNGLQEFTRDGGLIFTENDDQATRIAAGGN